MTVFSNKYLVTQVKVLVFVSKLYFFVFLVRNTFFFGKVCGKEQSFGGRWIQKGWNVYLYFMIFYNINNVCNNGNFISFSDLRSSENEIDSAGRPNSWRGDRLLKQLIFRKRDSEDIKQWTNQYKRSVTHCIFILYIVLF